jgi:hypothetical protein
MYVTSEEQGGRSTIVSPAFTQLDGRVSGINGNKRGLVGREGET